MPTAAACFLLPVGVVLYTIFGGLVPLLAVDIMAHANLVFSIKATFLVSYSVRGPDRTL